MYSSTGFIVLAFATSILAQGVCNADNCLRAVRATNAFPSPSSASKDCMSFFSKTAIIYPSTVTSTIVITQTASPVTSTRTIPASATATASGSATYISILTQTLYWTTVLTVPYTSTDTEMSTVTSTSTTVASITYTQTVPCSTDTALNKRFAQPSIVRYIKPGISWVSKSDDALAKRAPTFATTVFSPSYVPAYASVCSGISRYSSACSCNGISMKTTTFTAPTPTSFKVTYTVITPTSAALKTSTSTTTVTVTSTETVQIVFSITSSVTSTSQVEVFQTTTIPTTVIVPFTATMDIFATVTASCGPATCNETPDIQFGCDNGSYCTPSGTCLVEPDSDTCFNMCTGSCSGAQFDTSNNNCVIWGPDCC